MCLICMKYRIIILIIIIISLGQIFYRILQTHHARNARTRAHTCTYTAVTAVQAIAIRWHPTVMAHSACDNAGRWPLKYTHALATRFTRGFRCFSHIKKLLGRTETRTRDRMYCRTIRIVRDISRDDRARIATCSLQT